MLTGPKLETPAQVPPRTDKKIKRVMAQQPKREAIRVQKSAIPLANWYNVKDEVWVMNSDKSKLQPEKVGPAIILKVNDNNSYLVQGLGKRRADKVMHHDQLRPCQAQKGQCESALLASDQQIQQYGARVPENLPPD